MVGSDSHRTVFSAKIVQGQINAEGMPDMALEAAGMLIIRTSLDMMDLSAS